MFTMCFAQLGGLQGVRTPVRISRLTVGPSLQGTYDVYEAS